MTNSIEKPSRTEVNLPNLAGITPENLGEVVGELPRLTRTSTSEFIHGLALQFTREELAKAKPDIYQGIIDHGIVRPETIPGEDKDNKTERLISEAKRNRDVYLLVMGDIEEDDDLSARDKYSLLTEAQRSYDPAVMFGAGSNGSTEPILIEQRKDYEQALDKAFIEDISDTQGAVENVICRIVWWSDDPDLQFSYAKSRLIGPRDLGVEPAYHEQRRQRQLEMFVNNSKQANNREELLEVKSILENFKENCDLSLASGDKLTRFRVSLRPTLVDQLDVDQLISQLEGIIGELETGKF